jgi:6-phosphofructokinase 1
MFEDTFVIASRNQTSMKEVLHSLTFIKAVAREHVFFHPKNFRAARQLSHLRGLCPGLNVVIREIVMSLHYNYEAKDIWVVK